jgi:type IV secretory pathway VirB10-like protein
MRISVTHALRLTVLLAAFPLLQGCDQKTPKSQPQALAPPIVDTPPPKPATVSTADLPPPVVGPAQPAQPATTAASQPPPAPKKPARKPKKPTPAAAQPTQEAANTPPASAPSVSAIGELSSGASGDARSQAEEGINATEKGLNAITRNLSDSETKTAAQIREFLKQAREALTTGDVDGAITLTKKAKVLLAELNQ